MIVASIPQLGAELLLATGLKPTRILTIPLSRNVRFARMSPRADLHGRAQGARGTRSPAQ